MLFYPVSEPPSHVADYDTREPLCIFLDKPVPKKDLPSGNAPPAFMARIAEKRVPQYRQARINVVKTLGVVLAVVVALDGICEARLTAPQKFLRI